MIATLHCRPPQLSVRMVPFGIGWNGQKKRNQRSTPPFGQRVPLSIPMGVRCTNLGILCATTHHQVRISSSKQDADRASRITAKLGVRGSAAVYYAHCALCHVPSSEKKHQMHIAGSRGVVGVCAHGWRPLLARIQGRLLLLMDKLHLHASQPGILGPGIGIRTETVAPRKRRQ